MKTIGYLSGFFLLVSIFLSCNEKAKPSEIMSAEVQTVSTGNALKESWQQKWDKTLQAGRKEGSAVIYTSASAAPALNEMVPIFKQKFGINLELLTGRGVELTVKLLKERASGLFIADIFFGGLNTIYGAVKPAGALDPIEPVLVLPEVVDPKLWYGGELPWGDRGHMVFKWAAYPTAMIAINTTLVKPSEIKSYYDLLDPRWKDKILLNDPTITGPAFNGFSSLIYSKIVDMDFFRKLVSQQNQVLRDQRLQVDWLARGKYPVALWPLSSYMADYIEAGASIAFVEVKEGVYLSSGGANLTLLKNVPHPNASRIFINWLLSKEGQIHLQKSLHIHSARVDVPTDDVDPLQLRRPGQRYFVGANNIEEWVVNEQDKYLEYARQTFAPVLK